jgi:enoyl-CoA hydratase/carnithine racemase
MADLNAEIQTPDEEADAVRVTRPRAGVALVSIVSAPLGVLRHAVKRALGSALRRLEADPEVRCMVLTGTGKAFSVGSDIRDFSRDVGWLLENDYWEAGLNQAIEDARFPVIAACNGHTLGGGAVLALACDIRVAAASAKFGFPEVKVGAFASGSGTQRLPRLVGRGRALDLLLTGRVIDAAEALSYGLVEYLFPDAEMMERTLEMAEGIAAFPGPATAATKRCVNVGLREGTRAGLALEQELRVRTGRGADAAEGRQAFLEKRPARFNLNELREE